MIRISFIIVALNAARCLPLLLEDLLAQTIPPEQLELLLVDSMSTDGTEAVMRDFAARAPFPVKVLKNEKQWLASGINVALDAAQGDAVIRLDAHARIPADFLANNLRALESGEDIVGGCVAGAEPSTPWESVMRALDTSRFCGGAAPFRNAGEARYVDTLAYALYRREVYDRAGRYDERLRRTEDNDMHYRMRCAGYRFRFDPAIISYHAARATLRGQLRQKWGNGYWIGRTMHIQPRCFAPRHLVPALFVLALLGCLLLAPVNALPLALLASVYLCADLCFAVIGAMRETMGRLPALLALPFLFPAVHIVYGAGTIAGLLTPEKHGRKAE
ncbi:MAG: glycosyltransferase family 2 protein [Clostridia bacterium]|nr:glycosyltransferase family 2 protein [Clostridia bacterium]